MKKRRSSKTMQISSEKKGRYDGDQDQDLIPTDLTIEILKRLPIKTLVKFRCVSKFWSSIIRSREFVNLFFARSSTRPRIVNTLPEIARLRGRSFSLSRSKHLHVSQPVNGLVCAEMCSVLKICNPATKQFITLPAPETKTRTPSDYILNVINFLSYDPIDDQHKVLNTMMFQNRGQNTMIMEHQIFVLGENAWRRIQSGPTHSVYTDGLCINGIMYYGAKTYMDNLNEGSKIVAFNVKHENFKFINIPVGLDGFSFHDNLSLINFEGKLAAVDYLNLVQDNAINVWVLEDESKAEWLKKSYVLPSFWKDCIEATYSEDQLVLDSNEDPTYSYEFWLADLNEAFPHKKFILTGSINTDEIIIGPRCSLKSLCVVYYNLKTSNLRKVEIEESPNHEFKFAVGFRHFVNLCTFTEYVESIKLLDGLDQ